MNTYKKNNLELQPKRPSHSVGKINALKAISQQPSASEPQASCGCCSDTPPQFTSIPAGQSTGDGTVTAIRIMQMDCPVEENLITKKLTTMQGVVSLQFDLIQRILTVTHRDEKLDDILQAIRSLGFDPELPSSAADNSPATQPRISYLPLIIAGVLAFGAELLHWWQLPPLFQALCALAAVLLAGLKTYKKGWIAVKNFNLNINALMSVAVTGALLLQQWPEAAMGMVRLNIAVLIEAKALDRARNAIDTLRKLAPDRRTCG